MSALTLLRFKLFGPSRVAALVAYTTPRFSISCVSICDSLGDDWCRYLTMPCTWSTGRAIVVATGISVFQLSALADHLMAVFSLLGIFGSIDAHTPFRILTPNLGTYTVPHGPQAAVSDKFWI